MPKAPDDPDPDRSDDREPDGQEGRPMTQPVSTTETRATGPSFAAPESHVEDLSDALSETLPRGPGEVVRCRRIWRDRYRCNWWGPPAGSPKERSVAWGIAATTHRVVRSQMLRATRTGGGLLIDAEARQ